MEQSPAKKNEIIVSRLEKGYLEQLDDYDQRNCKGMDPNLFYPKPEKYSDSEMNYEQTISNAKRICQGCPIKNECLHEAIRDRIQSGIWGGRNMNDLNRIRSRIIFIRPNGTEY